MRQSVLFAAASLFALTAAAPALANDAAGDQIIVTGTRTSTERTVLTSPSAIDVFDEAAIRSAGAVGNELGQAIANLAPSFFFPRQSNSGTSDHIRAGQLRGLAPDQMLVLVNGKRRHVSAVVNTETKIGRGTAAVDFNTIPFGAVDRIEVLRDGAGAQYGSDAIAGVINIILDDAPEGFEFTSTYGFHQTRPGALGFSITDGETLTIEVEGGATIGENGFFRVGGEFENRNATQRAGFDQIPFFFPQTAPNLALQGERNYAEGDPDTKSFSLWANSAYDFGALEGYAFGTYDERDTDGATFFRYPDDNRNVAAIYPQGFLPITTGENEDLSVVAGVRGPMGGIEGDFSVAYGRNEFTYGVRNSLNASLGAASPRGFESGSYVFDQLSVNFDGAKDVAVDMFAGPLTVAFGGEYRREEFETRLGDPTSFEAGPFAGPPGAQGAPGLTPDDIGTRERDVYAGYVDLSAQVTDRLFVEIAGRYEDYSDFGDGLTGKASGIYTVSPALSFRGAVSNNFRAPALAQTGFADRTVNFGAGRTLVFTITAPVGSPVANALGAEALDAEQSFNASVGITGRIGENITYSVDAFRIAVDDRITLSERFFGAGVAAFVDPLPGGSGVQSVRFFTNAVDTRTEGVDVVVTYAKEIAAGVFDASIGFTYAKTEITDFADTPAELLAIDPTFVLVGPEEINTIEDAAPKTKLVATTAWSNERFAALSRVSRFGDATRAFNFGGGFVPTQTYGAEVQWDLEASVQAHERLNIALGANNVLDNYPDESDPAINFFGNLPYDILSPVGVNGRFLYARARLSF